MNGFIIVGLSLIALSILNVVAEWFVQREASKRMARIFAEEYARQAAEKYASQKRLMAPFLSEWK